MYVITEDGALIDYDMETGPPLEIMEWNIDTPSLKTRDDEKVTVELLWVA